MATRRRYTDMRDELKTGDVVLFSGRTGFSDAIKWFTWCRWSHVGMILRAPEYGEGPLVWESLRVGTIPDVHDGELKEGVQLLRMDERVERGTDDIAIRQLNMPITESMYAALMEFEHDMRDRPYERRLGQLIRAAYDGPFGSNGEDLTSVFCSELVAEALQVMGLLPSGGEAGGLPSNEYTPTYFSQKHNIDLLGPWFLGPEIELEKE